MIDHQEIEDIESLESQLLGKGMSINDMVRHYAKLLLELIQNGKLKNISDEKTSRDGWLFETGHCPWDIGVQ
ncbi:hypothetical protein [Pseudomonas chlororaphis]|uniref:hypothetical protein n=1 Tax=Pseudomonas chlororaphis TaxID=587753 RepID=UPI000F560609|nr:hypothetical protein [Pseudomonas chlororaphis]AZD55370.1 hypothetical protein C4K19_3585 [Pseudomonas chlororaphis subsp. aurantiaca]